MKSKKRVHVRSRLTNNALEEALESIINRDATETMDRFAFIQEPHLGNDGLWSFVGVFEPINPEELLGEKLKALGIDLDDSEGILNAIRSRLRNRNEDSNNSQKVKDLQAAFGDGRTYELTLANIHTDCLRVMFIDEIDNGEAGIRISDEAKDWLRSIRTIHGEQGFEDMLRASNGKFIATFRPSNERPTCLHENLLFSGLELISFSKPVKSAGTA